MAVAHRARGFDTAEFESRCALAQSAMAAAEIDAVVVTSPPNVRYFSGFATEFWESPTRPWFVIVPRQGLPVAVIPEIGAPAMARTWIEDIRTWPAPRPADDGVTLLAEVLETLPRRFGRIGWEMGPGPCRFAGTEVGWVAYRTRGKAMVRAAKGAKRRGGESWIRRKNVNIDQSKLDRVKELLKADSETEAIDQALSMLLLREELVEGIEKIGGTGGVTNYFEDDAES
jgi:Xaa-Pro aminopeptidase